MISPKVRFVLAALALLVANAVCMAGCGAACGLAIWEVVGVQHSAH